MTETHYPITKPEAHNLLIKTYKGPKPGTEEDSEYFRGSITTLIKSLPLQELFWLYDRVETQLFTEPTGQPYDVDIPDHPKYANMDMMDTLLEIMVQRLEVDHNDMQDIILDFFKTYHPDKIEGTEAEDYPKVNTTTTGDNAENLLNDFKVNQYLPDMNDIEYKLDELKKQVNALSPNRETPTEQSEQDFPAEEYIPAIRELQETVNHLQETLPKLNTQLYEFIQDATD